MKKPLIILLIAVALPFLISQKSANNGEKPYAEGQIMVKLRSDVSPAQQQEMIEEFLQAYNYLGLSFEEKLSSRLNILLLNFTPGVLEDEQVLSAVQSHPDVELAQFNHFIEMRELIPTDQFFSEQWNMNNTGQNGGIPDADIDATEAWEIPNAGVTATGDTIVIAIVDDGFDLEHEDLEFWKNTQDIPGNNIDDDQNGYIDDYHGWSSWTNSGNIIEKDHGTHVSGIAAAQGNNDKGVAGVNWNVKVMPVVGSATVESIVVAGYAYVHEMRARYNESDGEHGAFIVATNASFGVNNGLPEDFPIWGAMYDSLGALGVLSAGATANANWNVDVLGDIPTTFTSDWLITVTNTNSSDVKNTSAGYGAVSIDLGAPGTAVYSTRWQGLYGLKTGTSMSAPHVSGAIAFLFSIADANFMQAYHNDPAGMALVIRQHILNGVDPVPSLDGITVTGGRLNVYKSAMEMLNPDLILDPLSILSVIPPDRLDTVEFHITNNTAGTFDYSVTYPSSADWLSLSGAVSGTLVPDATASINVYFTSMGMEEDTLYTFLDISYGDGMLFQQPVHLYIDQPVQVEEAASGSEILRIWPNPARDILNLEFPDLNPGGSFTVSLYDASGKLVEELSIWHPQKDIRIPAGDYLPGIYFAILREDGQIIANQKVIITR